MRERLAAHEPERLAEQARTQASVATILREGPTGAEVLLIQRAEHPDDPWSGHMAFPGGRRDPGDVHLLDTAMRETREELGVDLAIAEHLGHVDDLQAVARGRVLDLVIRPQVFLWPGEPPPLTPNYEVAAAVWAPIAPMIAGEIDTVRPWREGTQTYRMPAYDVEGRIVWGLTYRMLRTLFAIVEG
ncbi:MAG: NUDIX domain-containing protein [Actinobacteria bacterium]|nr:CoA pyrophosphatase [Actinomycetota bacterium]NIS29195.1 CoA pyrophosphatase [Actinomycetota bacterium]NIU64596.1 CoA pyrophosphatase [Actinomycetota bacterium]NIW26380.1 NUDIX domain-containing protein [Actinomycetota bacterium]NIX18950.1 NUDIX domain-containing protein [Actinomycetota bacterium]